MKTDNNTSLSASLEQAALELLGHFHVTIIEKKPADAPASLWWQSSEAVWQMLRPYHRARTIRWVVCISLFLMVAVPTAYKALLVDNAFWLLLVVECFGSAWILSFDFIRRMLNGFSDLNFPAETEHSKKWSRLRSRLLANKVHTLIAQALRDLQTPDSDLVNEIHRAILNGRAGSFKNPIRKAMNELIKQLAFGVVSAQYVVKSEHHTRINRENMDDLLDLLIPAGLTNYTKGEDAIAEVKRTFRS